MRTEENILLEVTPSDIKNGTCKIPDDITVIGDYAFYRCEELKHITVPNNVMEIGNFAFSKCRNLERINIPNSITKIGNHAFDECRNLKNIVIPESVTHIGQSAFYKCTGLESVTLPKDISGINFCTFDICNSLTEIKWGKICYHVKCIETMCMNILSEKTIGTYHILKCQYFSIFDKIVWVVQKKGITALGSSLKTAVHNADYEFLRKCDTSEHVARIQKQNYVTPLDYRLITNASEKEIDNFLKSKNLNWNSRLPIEKVIELTKGKFGHSDFLKYIENTSVLRIDSHS